jgi:hypothetical protein
MVKTGWGTGVGVPVGASVGIAVGTEVGGTVVAVGCGCATWQAAKIPQSKTIRRREGIFLMDGSLVIFSLLRGWGKDPDDASGIVQKE